MRVATRKNTFSTRTRFLAFEFDFERMNKRLPPPPMQVTSIDDFKEPAIGFARVIAGR